MRSYVDAKGPKSQKKKKTKLPSLEKRAQMPNLCAQTDNLGKIGQDVVRLTKLDDRSRDKWLTRAEKGMELAMQHVDNDAEPGKSNVKYPLITSAALAFHARAYSSIIQGNRVVKSQVTGEDADNQKAAKARRIAAHMNFQLLEENEDWESDTDKLLLAVCIEGCEFKKTYFSKELKRNVSEWVRPVDLIVHNDTKSFASAPRITHRMRFYPHEIDSKIRAGLWRDAELQISDDEYEDETLQEFYEQHTYLDLDNDGLKEPYVVTVHVSSEQVVRIICGFLPQDIQYNGKKVTKIPRIEIFTKFGFIPSPDGSFYDFGFGQLIGPLSDAVDTNINQLIDAGTLANQQAGFILDGVSVEGKRGNTRFQRGEFKRIKTPAGKTIQQSIFPLNFKDPSMVLFQLLGTLIQASKDVTSVQDIMTGGAGQHEEKATTSMIRVEQGMKVFSSIYKRLYRSFKEEFKKIYKLNSYFLNDKQYFMILDTQVPEEIWRQDYQDPTDVQPVADPQLATSMLALAKNQQLMTVIQHPLVNDEDVLNRFFAGLDIPNPERLIIPEDQRQQQPDPELVLKAQIEASKHAERRMSMLRDYADAMKKFAEAESEEEGQQWQQYMHMAEVAMGVIGGMGGQGGQGGQGEMGGMEGGQPGVPKMAPGPQGQLPPGGGAGPVGPGPG